MQPLEPHGAAKTELTGDELRRWRRQLGLTQRALAAALGVTTNSVARWERGDLTIRNAQLLTLALTHLSEDASDDGRGATQHGFTSEGRSRYGPSYLPRPVTALVGRDRTLTEVIDCFRARHRRLLTLVGPGGAGKTHLALATANALAADFADGGRLVELADVGEDRLAAPLVARAFGVREPPTATTTEALGRALAGCDALLVLDNCEHVLEGTAQLVSELMRRAPGLSILATSREALRVRGEQRFEVAPLTVPALDHLPAPAALAKVPAVEMFVDRWRESHPTFKLTAEHARAVAEVCVGLEGLPLALELATAQPGPATPAAVLSGLGAVLDLAAPRLRDVPGRQRSLRATQEWSYGLLDAEQRALFRSLGVFVGGFNLDAACAVAHAHRGEDFPVGTALDALCESHLVRVETFPGDEVRYSMLEPVRQYAVDRLVTADEDVDARASHAAFFTAMAESDESRLWDHRQLEWLDTLERELPNFRAALAWCRSPAGDPSLGLRLAVAMRRYWDMRGHVAESHDHLRAFLDAVPAETPARIYGLVEIGLAATRDEDVETTTALCNEALHLAEGIDDASGISVALSGLSLAAFFQGDMATAADLATRSLVAARLVDDRPTLANALMIRAVAAMGTGDLSGAELLLDDSLRVAGGLGDRWLRAEALVVLGNLRYVRGDAAGARVAYIDSLKPHAELGNRAGLATSLKLVGSVMAEAGELKRAAQLLGAGESLAEATGATWPASWPISCDTAVSTLRSRLSEAHYASATRAGRELPLQSAIMLAAMPAESNNDEPIGGLARRQSPGGLSAREHDVALLIAQGRTNREIARTLTIAKRTADTHVERIMAKLDVHSRAEVAAWVQAPR